MPILPPPKVYQCRVKIEDQWVDGKCHYVDTFDVWHVVIQWEDFPDGAKKRDLLRTHLNNRFLDRYIGEYITPPLNQVEITIKDPNENFQILEEIK